MPKALRILLLLLVPALLVAGTQRKHAPKPSFKQQNETSYFASDDLYSGPQATESNGITSQLFKPTSSAPTDEAILFCFASQTATQLHCANSAFLALKPLLFAPVFIRICVLRI